MYPSSDARAWAAEIEVVKIAVAITLFWKYIAILIL